MIAFYVLSNLNLLNAALVKWTYFPEEEADLIIRANLPQLSGKLVRAYVKNGTFHAVHPIPHPYHLRPECGKYGKIPGIRKITCFWDHYRYNESILSRTVGKQKYDTLIVPYLGNMIEYIAVYLKKCNPDIQIAFYEEGSFTYTRPISQLLSHMDMGKRTWKDIFADKIGEEFFLRQARKNAIRDMYLHIPNPEMVDPWFQNLRLLPPVARYPECLRPLKEMSAHLKFENVEMYRRRMAVFLAGYCDPISNAKLENCQAMEDDFLVFMTMCQTLGMNECILKPHPGSKVAVEHLGKNFESSRLYIDRNAYLFETMFLAAEDCEDLLLIGRYSATALNIKFWLDKEPYFIYTHRLFPSYVANQDHTIDRFIENVKSTYRDPEKIMVPNSMAEYKDMLKWVREKIWNKRCHCDKLAIRDNDQMQEGCLI